MYKEKQTIRKPNIRLLVLLVAMVMAFVAFGCAPREQVTENPAIVSAKTKRVEIAIDGMTCSSCAVGVKTMLKHTEGVVTAEVSFERSEAIVRYDETRTNHKKVLAAITKFGYKAAVK